MSPIALSHLGDDPAYAAVNKGGPSLDPGVLCPPQKFAYEVGHRP